MIYLSQIPTIIMDISNPVLIWMFLIVAFIIFILIATILLFKYSKKPKNWTHSSLTEDSYTGILRDLSDSIKSEKKLSQFCSSIDETLMMMFFKKIENLKDVPYDRLIDMRKNNSHQLYEIIKDGDIINWIEKIEKEEKTDKIKRINKQKYLKEIKIILDKMEAWGK